MKREVCDGNCWGCIYADQCNNWNDVAPYNNYVQYTDTAYMALCSGRHEIKDAKDGAIFDVIQDPTDVKGLEKYALKKLLDLDIRYLNLYVTGLTVALIASLNACKKLDIKVTLWHFDRETDTYFSQEVCR